MAQTALHATELRIGNWVNVGGYSHQVIDIMIDGLNTLEHECYPYDMIEPIPLSHEILEKCGFVKEENGWHKLRICEDYINLYFEQLAKAELSVSGLGIKMPHIQYLHQLQNLIHALTGEELTVKF
jgi:hypothetical protein